MPGYGVLASGSVPDGAQLEIDGLPLQCGMELTVRSVAVSGVGIEAEPIIVTVPVACAAPASGSLALLEPARAAAATVGGPPQWCVGADGDARASWDFASTEALEYQAVAVLDVPAAFADAAHVGRPRP